MDSKGFNYLLSVNTDPKTAKSNKYGEGKYLTAIQYLAPAKLSGVMNTCPSATAGCIASCLHTAGNPVYLKVKTQARIARTKYFHAHRELYKALLVKEMTKFVKKAAKLDAIPCVRLNGTSDIVWEVIFPELFTMFPQVKFYDYTKIAKRVTGAWAKLPTNYYLTLSRAESNHADIENAIANNPVANIAVVFGNCGISAHPKPLPATYLGREVVDADLHDLRFLDGEGVVAGLRAKGKARKDNSGFVVMV